MSFANLKKNSQSGMERLQKEMEKQGGKEGYQKDERLWSLERDKSGNGMAVIRFLPAPEGEDIPMVRVFSHGFQGKGGWFIENCPTTIGRKCPVCEANNELWNSGIEDNKKVARDRKRKLSYISNILVISDPANRENEGKVFLFKYGKKIFDKILDKMQPQFQDEKPIDPFNFWEGCNFKLKIVNVEGYRNYDKSQFDSVTPLFNGDEAKLEAVYNQLHPLKEFLDPKNYKTYEELKKKLHEVLGEEGLVLPTAEAVKLDEKAEAPKIKTAAAPSFASASTPTPANAAVDDDEGDTLSYFAKLAKEG